MLSAAPASAEGEPTVAVLGLRAPDGEDKLARELTSALREQTALVSHWTKHPANQTLEQLMLINGCESANRACYRQVAAGLKTDAVVTGSVKRSARGQRYHYIVEFLYFDSKSGQVKERLRERLVKSRADAKSIERLARRAITKFAGKAPAKPVVLLEDPVAVTPPSDADAAPEPDEPEGKKQPKLWPALTMYGVTAVSVGLLTWNWITIGNVEDDPDFQQARINAGAGVGDVCAGPGNFGVANLGSLCDKAQRHEIMQYVFISTGVISAGLGTWLLVRHLKGRSSERADKLQLTPMVGRREGGISARLKF